MNAEQDNQVLDRELALAFAPLHKRNLGLAVGVAGALLMFVATLAHTMRSPDEDYPLILLRHYFAGYTVSVAGAFVGALWGFFVGFFMGWFFAFCRNLAIAVATIIFRTRAELAENRGFLDNI